MKIKIKKLDADAVIPFKTHSKDFCYDVTATSIKEVAPNVYQYGTGLCIERYDGDSSLYRPETVFGITLRPRSSIWRTGMVLANSVGTIDDTYRGEIKATFYHIMPNMPKYEIGDKIGQIHIDLTLKAEFEDAWELSETERGEGGFGSTDIKTKI